VDGFGVLPGGGGVRCSGRTTWWHDVAAGQWHASAWGSSIGPKSIYHGASGQLRGAPLLCLCCTLLLQGHCVP
jgi:hypothetical protein